MRKPIWTSGLLIGTFSILTLWLAIIIASLNVFYLSGGGTHQRHIQEPLSEKNERAFIKS